MSERRAGQVSCRMGELMWPTGEAGEGTSVPPRLQGVELLPGQFSSGKGGARELQGGPRVRGREMLD